MAEHPAVPRLAEIYVTDAAGVDRRGTGYLAGPGWVLTAAHVVHDARSIELWLGAPRDPRPEDGIRVHPPSVLVASGAEPGRPDLALLPVPIGDGNVDPVLFGRLDRAVVQRVPAVAAGFPRFRLRPVREASSDRLRELTYATGAIVPGGGIKKGQFALNVDDAPGADPDPRHSPWEGMSGAAVWAGARLARGDAEKLAPADDVAAAPVLPDRIEAVVASGDGEVRLLTDAPVTLVDLATGAVVDPRPPADLVSMALTGQPSGDFVESGEGGGPRLRVAPGASVREQRFGKRLILRAQEPERWPTVTRAYGRVGRVPVVARGSYEGAVWITDLTTGQTTHGPFISLTEESTIFFGVKPSPRVVDAVAVGDFGGAARVAAAFEGHAWIADLVSEPELRVLDTPSVVAVALGAVGGGSVAVTGSISGLVGIWRADTGERIAGLTLDAGVNRVWVVHGTDAVAACTIDGALVIADLVS